MSNYLRTSYEVLSKIYREKSFSTETLYDALEKKENSELIHRIVLGTLERDVELSYILRTLTEKQPKPVAAIVIKQGIYCLKYMNSLPDYAVIDNSVELIKELGKFQLSGFVNAVLKKAARGEYKLPDDDGSDLDLSVKYSKPQWFIALLTEEFGRDTAINIIAEQPYTLTHVRANTRIWDSLALEKFFAENGISFTATEAGGYCVRVVPEIKKLFSAGKITYQSATSMLAAHALDVKDGMRVLDLCAAPGGKSVLLAEESPNAEVLACDIYPHRIGLIEKYASRMKIKNVFVAQNDATRFNPEFEGRFDRVLADAPCSALGITGKQPDILLNRQPADIKELAKLQLRIAENASKYLKNGGKMVYSTCTLTKEENGDNVQKLIESDKTLSFVSQKQYLPQGYTDGFFVAVLDKK